jgi:FlaA1/EpsC-like NDP-sugar epimerase
VGSLARIGGPSAKLAANWPRARARSFDALGSFALSRTRPTTRWIVVLVDAGLCATCCYISILLRLGFLPDRDTPYALMVCVSIAMAIPIFAAMGLYREIFSQAGVRTILAVGRACLIYALPFTTLFTYIGIWGIPRTLCLIQPILLFVSMAASRLFARYWLFGTNSLRRVPRRRVMIYGAGSAGRQLAGAIAHSADMAVVGFFDDNPALFGSIIDGCRIYSPADMSVALDRVTAEEILLALPSAPPARRKEIVARAREVKARIRTLPGLMDIAHGRVEMTQLREVQIEDLLGRESVEGDRAMMQQAIGGRVVMVTGAGGSIGSEICRRLLDLQPAALLLFDLSESALYEIDRELRERSVEPGAAGIRIVPLLGSVFDEARVEEIVSTWRPEVIYHAAAYKHVPLVEYNVAQGVRTNAFGTLTLARVAARWSVPNVTLISTDKAVRPTNVMGATKRVAELIFQAFDRSSAATSFSIVRFGNVLGTSGSVVPLFRRQIRGGGPVTLTDRRMTRYFMTASEAAELVVQASAMSDGGEVFVLDMGEPVKIRDLAVNMIELAGLSVRDEENPSGDIPIVEVGLRPGEKLFEELLIGSNPLPTGHPRIFQARERFLPLDLLETKLERIESLLQAERRAELVSALAELVPEFHKEGGLVDCVSVEVERTLVESLLPRTA